jgi:predicted LPLAT superfamily acyltransferase
MFRRAASTVTSLVEELDPSLATRVIELGTPEAMLRVREAVLQGEIVALLADRAVGEQKLVWSDFLGAPAAFAAGPLILAAGVQAPVMLFYGIRTGPRRYIVQFEPFADRVQLRRSDRMADLRPLVERYAASLEARCRAYPYNWFNFYNFWNSAERPGSV